MGTMEFRFADESDTAQLLALINQAFSVEAFFHIGSRLDPDRIQPHLRNGRFLVAESGGKLVGCVYVELRGEESYLGLLSVDPTQQKTGLGRRLVAAAEEFAREMGARRMDLTVVNLRTELPPYYEKLGYRIVGEEPIPEQMKARVNQPCYFLRMSKPLGEG
jgi:predicted N-acetyltransferase YhbS